MSWKKLLDFFRGVGEPIKLPYSSVRIAVWIYLGLLIFGAAAYVCLASHSQLIEYFEKLGYRYDMYTFIADLLTYTFAAWLAYQVADALARIYLKMYGNLLVATPKQSQVLWYVIVCIFCLAMLLTLEFGWLYFCLIALIVILLPGIILRTFTQEKKIGLALAAIVVSQVIPLIISRFVTTVLSVLITITVCCLVAGLLCLAVEKRAAGFACIGIGLGAAYYAYVYAMYQKSSTSQVIATFLDKVLNARLFMIGFTPLYKYALSTAQSFQGPLFPFVLLLFLAIAAIPEELLCRSVIPRVGLYLTTVMFLSLHIPTRLAAVVMPFGSMVMPIVVGLLITVIFLIGLGAGFILFAYREAGLVGSITLHAFYDTLVTLYYMGYWTDILIANAVLLVGLLLYATATRLGKL